MTAKYVGFVCRHLYLSLAVVILTACVTFFISSKLTIKGDIKELLPENYPSVVELNRALERIGGVGSLIVTVESPSPEANKRFLDALAVKLNELPKGTVRYLDYKSEAVRKFYEKYALHYLPAADIDSLYEATKRKIDTEKLSHAKLFVNFADEDPLETEVNDIKKRNEKANSAPIKTFEDYYGEADGRFLIMIVRPYENSLSVDAARKMIATVENEVAHISPSSFDPAMKVGYCGNVKSTVEEYDTLKKDVTSTTLLCITLVGLAIIIFFMRLRVVFLLGTTLIVALSWTFAVTYLAIGYLNSQTAFLGSIILGTGINYGIIVMARYIEERRKGVSHQESMKDALINTMSATFLAAATTAVAFIVLLLAGIKGLNQFGLIGAYGVMFCWLATMLVLPVIVLFTERVKNMVTSHDNMSRGMSVYRVFSGWITSKPHWILSGALIVSISSIILIGLHAKDAIEYDFTKLRNKTSVASGTEALENRVSKLFNDSMTPAVVVVDKIEDGALVCEAIEKKNLALPERERRVGSCRSVYSLVPKSQQEKMPKLAMFASLLDENEKYLGMIDAKAREKVDSIRVSLSDNKILTLNDIPRDLSKHFEDLSGEKGRVVFISPRAGMLLSDGRNLVKFADTIREFQLSDGRVMHAAGSSLIFADLVNAIRQEAPILTLASFIAVMIFVAVVVRRSKASSLVIVCTVLVGIIAMLGFGALLKIKLNFFNFIALPLTFGIGVDYAINIALRLSKDNLSKLEFAFRHTGMAVVLCSLTTIIGYSVLILANNQALSSFGMIAIVGEVTCLFSAMLLAPALLVLLLKRFGVKQTQAEENKLQHETTSVVLDNE